MTTLSSATAKTLTLSSSSIFLASYRSHSQISPQTPTPPSFNFLSDGSNLPPIPSNFPHSKIIPNTRFVVDGFRSAGDFSVSYFLTHFHADHYTGLNPNWCRGVVFCSDITANLLVESLNVSPLFVVPLPLDETVQIDGCDVTAVDANHCPGAVQFLFRLADRQRYIHTGDFRFKTSMKSDPNLCRFVGADAVFLDTTYCNPKFVFPSQEESVDYIASTITRIRDRNEESGEPMLFLIATYVIGKEKILLEIARRCNVLLHVDAKKLKILSILGFGDSGIFTEDLSATNVHVIGWNLLGETWPYFRPNFAKMKEIMEERGYSKAVGFVSTGWMYETKRDGFSVRVKDLLEIHLAPYSEHSNYDELREYVRFLRPKRVIPTVGADVEKLDGKHALTMQKHFVGLVDETANKEEFLMPFRQILVESDARAGDAKANIGGKPEDVEERSESVLKLLQIEEGSSLLVANVQNEENIEGAVNELRDCLPSWVSHDQIVCLLKGSGGDIVGAVSEFFENETVFYEQVNACEKSVSSKQESVHDVFGSLSHQKPAQIDLDCKKNLNNEKNPKSQNLAILSSKLPKKRGSGNGNKPRKKGKSSSPLESSGRKQSTITKYFGRVGFLTSSASDEGGTSTTGQHLKNGKALIVDTAETHKEDLDRFLQIINGGMERDAAASMLEKAKGNIDVAVDIYYSKSNSASGNEGILVSCSLQSEMHDCLTSSFTVKSSNLYEETTNSPTLFMQRTSVEDPTMTCVSLSIDNFSPIEHACWKAGQPAAYLHLARTFDLVEREKGKIKTTLMLCNMFRSLLALSPEDVLPALYLCTNKIAADHENMELNIGGTMVIAALEEVCGTNKSNIKEMYKIYGDLGDVAQECRQSQSLLAPPRPLSVHSLFCMLRKISTETGSGSAVRRKNLIVNLMRSCREMEIKFLVRTLVRNLRIGAMMRTILPALAQAVVLNSSSEHHLGSSESLKSRLQGISAAVVEAYNIAPSLDLLVPSLLNKGINFSASSVLLAPGTPIPPMLARITNGIIQVLKLFEGRAFTCEYKYDGQRAQIHRLADGTIRVFSRNMKENTFKFPDLISIIKESCNPAVLSFILDAEIVAVDRKNGIKLMSFQELSSRERGSKEFAVNADSIKVDICIFLFDIMLFNGKRLLALPLRQRRDYLKDLLHMEKKGYLEFAKEITVEADETCCDNQSTLFRVNSFFEDACKSSCEGIMAKSLDIDAGYCASKRSEAWLKVKRDYVEGLGDSLDLVPIGAWHGNGRKAGWYSPFLMACYNPDAEEYQSVCRVMSGFSDSFYTEMKEFFSGERMLTKKPPYYRTDESPDLWFSPELVWEIRGADLTISPVHHAAVGLVHPSRGISVRLPRHVRSLADRRPEDCSTSADIACMFRSQTRKMEVKTED